MEKSIHSGRYAIFLKVLREMRERAGLTQVQLARNIGETQTFVSKVSAEKGGLT
jgi:predicted transcriptional regulator